MYFTLQVFQLLRNLFRQLLLDGLIPLMCVLHVQNEGIYTIPNKFQFLHNTHLPAKGNSPC